MATLTVSRVGLVESIEQLHGVLGETVTAGQYVRHNTTTGAWELGKDTDTTEGRMGGIALNGGISGQGVDVLREGTVDLGDAFTGMTFDDIVYLSDTDGTLADAAGSTGRVVGSVVPGLGSFTTKDKLLRVKMND